MDQKEEDKSENSFQSHLVFYQKLNNKIVEIQKEIQNSADSKILKHLNERIKALELDKKRIRNLFSEKDDDIWESN